MKYKGSDFDVEVIFKNLYFD